MWGGRIRFTSPMLFAIGMVAMFTVGGLSGVTHAVSPADTQQTDTYYIVAHFHYVLFGGALFVFVGAMYYYWPKAFGYFLSDTVGKVNFWILFVGFNLTFGPMHILGLWGQPRRIYTYRSNYGFAFWNFVSTIGAVIIGVSFLILAGNIAVSYVKAKKAVNGAALVAPPDPWDARSLEWLTPNPPPPHNFDYVPLVHGLDEVWWRKYREEDGRMVRIRTAEEVVEKGDRTGVHLPSPSYWPIVLAFGLPFIAWGLIYNLWLCLLGGFFVIAGVYGWVLEPSVDDSTGHDDHEPHDGPEGSHDTDEGGAAATDEEAALVD
jgi:cytochrome c oxidase subunit 1